MLQDLLSRLLPPDAAGQAGTRQVALLSSCLEPHGNDLLLVFGRGERIPGHVIKMTRDPAFNRKIVNEGRALQWVGSFPALEGRVPGVVRRGLLQGRAFVVLRGLDGQSLFQILLTCRDDATAIGLLLQASALLAEINVLPARPELDLDLRGNSLSPAAGDLLRASTAFLSAAHRDALAAAREDVSGLPGGFFLHGDFWPTNILLDRESRVTGLIDWEFVVPAAPWPSDIGWFLVNAAHVLDLRARPSATLVDSFRRAFFDERRHGDLLFPVCADYLRRVGVGREKFRSLLALTLLQLAHRERCAYGRHAAMDAACRTMLLHLLDNERDFAVR